MYLLGIYLCGALGAHDLPTHYKYASVCGYTKAIQKLYYSMRFVILIFMFIVINNYNCIPKGNVSFHFILITTSLFVKHSYNNFNVGR